MLKQNALQEGDLDPGATPPDPTPCHHRGGARGERVLPCRLSNCSPERRQGVVASAFALPGLAVPGEEKVHLLRTHLAQRTVRAERKTRTSV